MLELWLWFCYHFCCHIPYVVLHNSIILIIITNKRLQVREEQEAIAAQKAAEEAAEAARIQAEHDRLNVVYEDKPVSAKEWISDTMDETSEEVNAQSTIHFIPYREPVCLEITRPKTQTSKKFSFYNRDAGMSTIIYWTLIYS